MVGGWGREGEPLQIILCLLLWRRWGEGVWAAEVWWWWWGGWDGGGCGCVVGQQHNQIQHDHKSSLYYLLQKCRGKHMYLCSVMLQILFFFKKKTSFVVVCCGFCMTFVVLSHFWRECIGVCWDLVDKLKKNQKSNFLFVLVVCRNSKILKNKKTQQNTILKNKYSCVLGFWRKNEKL